MLLEGFVRTFRARLDLAQRISDRDLSEQFDSLNVSR